VIDKISPSLVGKSVLLVAEYDDCKIFGSPVAVIKTTQETDEKTKRLETHHKVEWDSPPIFDFAMEAKRSKLRMIPYCKEFLRILILILSYFEIALQHWLQNETARSQEKDTKDNCEMESGLV
jgi:hypothetical protein